MSRILCHCGYCGIKWIDENVYSWQTPPRNCPHCAEVKNIEIKILPKEGLDVFGYRFDVIPEPGEER